MNWEIQEAILERDNILNIKIIDEKRLEWDFAVESRFDLCALFPRMQEEQLEDYKENEVRPLLYHKSLRTYHMLSNGTCAQFSLFPATIKNGRLYIGNQKENNIIILDHHINQLNVIIEQKNKYNKIVRRILTLQYKNTMKKLYYKIDDFPKLLFQSYTSNRTVIIPIYKGQKISFYTDEMCREKIGELV